MTKKCPLNSDPQNSCPEIFEQRLPNFSSQNGTQTTTLQIRTLNKNYRKMRPKKGFKDSNLPTNRSESFLTHTRTEIHFSKKGKKSNVKRKTFLCKNPLKFSNFENSATWRSVFPLVRHVWSDCRRTNGNVSFARKKKTGVSRDVTT